MVMLEAKAGPVVSIRTLRDHHHRRDRRLLRRPYSTVGMASVSMLSHHRETLTPQCISPDTFRHSPRICMVHTRQYHGIYPSEYPPRRASCPPFLAITLRFLPTRPSLTEGAPTGHPFTTRRLTATTTSTSLRSRGQCDRRTQLQCPENALAGGGAPFEKRISDLRSTLAHQENLGTGRMKAAGRGGPVQAI